VDDVGREILKTARLPLHRTVGDSMPPSHRLC
jgi:hypothetical protein